MSARAFSQARPTAEAEAAQFQRLVKRIEHELELAGRGRVEELRAAVRETGEYMLTLPPPTTLDSRYLVHRARALRSRVTIETRRLQASVGQSRASIKRARRMARTYVPRPTRRYTTSA